MRNIYYGGSSRQDRAAPYLVLTLAVAMPVAATACQPVQAGSDGRLAPALVDSMAWPETQALFDALYRLAPDRLLFGHVDANVMGINRDGTGWFFDAGRSDVRDVVGDYPAVFGFDLVNLLGERGPWSPTLVKTLDRMREAHELGGVVTVVWHAFNPVTGGDYYSGAPVPELLPGGARHSDLRGLLDKLAAAVGNLQDGQGRIVPIIFRPWHEGNGSQFWWGSGRCTDAEYKELFRFTVEYLRDYKHVHNFIYAYSPVDWWSSMDDYMQRYPGDDYVDVLGLDSYGNNSQWYFERLRYYARAMTAYAGSRGKLAAFTELGYKKSESETGLAHSDNPWWISDLLLGVLGTGADTRGLAFAAFWRNEAYNPGTFYMAYPGSRHEDDLERVYGNPSTLFLADLVRAAAQAPK
jgi:mannan endo-1,4-beta-mannosidase